MSGNGCIASVRMSISRYGNLCYLAISAKAEHDFEIWTTGLTYGSLLNLGSCSLRNLSPSILQRFSPAEIKRVIWDHYCSSQHHNTSKGNIPHIRLSPSFRGFPNFAILARSVVLTTRWSSVIAIGFPSTLTERYTYDYCDTELEK